MEKSTNEITTIEEMTIDEIESGISGGIDKLSATVKKTGFEQTKGALAGIYGTGMGLGLAASPLASAGIGAVAFASYLLFNSVGRYRFINKVERCLGEKAAKDAIEFLRLLKTFDDGQDFTNTQARKARSKIHDMKVKMKSCKK